MKYRLTAGMKIGKLTLVKRLPMRPDDYAYRWLCRCDCGKQVEKSRVVLTDPKVQHRCDECFSKAAKAYGRLMYIAANLEVIHEQPI